jgi:hypothetical protein
MGIGRQWVIFAALCLAPLASAGTWKIDALQDLRARYGLGAFDAIDGIGERLNRIKVAVIDNGFGDPDAAIRELPPTVFKPVFQFPEAFLKLHPHLGDPSDIVEMDTLDKHGREMATIVWGMTGMNRADAPEILLVNGFKFFNFERAVQYCVDNKVDIILYSQNYESGGNFDGRGYINAVVNKATSANILWVNAAGNYGGRVFNAPVKFEAGKVVAGEDTWLDLNGKKALRLLSRVDDNGVRIVLSWNRNGERQDVGTDANLDLFLYDEYGSLVASSEQKQVLGPKFDAAKGETLLVREIINTTLSRNRGGYYTLRVKARSGHFNGTDRLRITVYPVNMPIVDEKSGRLVDTVELVDATRTQEIATPADHPDVITVGDLSRFSAVGPTADGRAKPDFHMVTSQVEFTNGTTAAGTSHAAAMFAGIAAMLKAVRPAITRSEILSFVKHRRPSELRRGEARGVIDLGIDHVRSIHPIVFDALDMRFRDGIGVGGTMVLLAGRYRRNGPYVIALDRSPAALSRYWPVVPSNARDVDSYEIYLRPVRLTGAPTEAWAYVRPRGPREGVPRQAWEKELEENPEQFVQVIQARRLEIDPNEKTIPVWETPTPAALRALPTP